MKLRSWRVFAKRSVCEWQCPCVPRRCDHAGVVWVHAELSMRRSIPAAIEVHLMPLICCYGCPDVVCFVWAGRLRSAQPPSSVTACEPSARTQWSSLRVCTRSCWHCGTSASTCTRTRMIGVTASVIRTTQSRHSKRARYKCKAPTSVCNLLRLLNHQHQTSQRS